MTNTTPTDPALILAGIIREVDGAHRLGAAALAEAILAHPASQWGPVQPTAAWPMISDALIRRLVGTTAETAEAACGGRHVNPVREVRARLLEVLKLAAKDGAE